MRILHLSKYYHPYRGGIEKVIKELSETALRQGHEVTVLCANEINERQEEMVSGVRVIRLPKWTSIFSQPVTPSVFWEMQSLIDQADVVHLHTPNPLFELACLQFEFRCPFIVTYHCEVMKARALNNLYRPVAIKILEKADRILVATHYHIEFSKWLKPYEFKCEVIPFGIEPKHSTKTLDMTVHLNFIKQKYGRYFLFVGRMVSYKGIHILLESMKSVDQNLILIGKGPLLEMMKQMSIEKGVSSRVHFVGAVEADHEFAAYLHGADALVLPSINEAEAFGLVLLEAMSCRKPVITTALNSGVRYVNIPGETGLMVPPSDAGALAQAMNQMSSENEMRLRLGDGAFRHFDKHFQVDESFRRHEAVYTNVDRLKSSKTA